MPKIVDVALAYLTAGRSIVPIAPHRKAPSILDAGIPVEIRWQRYQRTPPSPAEVRSWYRGQACLGIGIVAGPVSGATLDDGTQVGLEFLDIDAPDIVPVFEGLVMVRGYDKLLASLPCENTPKGGRHYGYLCWEWAGNTVFARRKIGVKPDGTDDIKTLIETRGDGGQCVVAPTPPGIHPDHPERGYVMVRGGWERVPIVTPEARHALWNCANALNEYAPEPARTAKVREPRQHAGNEPGDLYNTRISQAEILALLERHDWTAVYSRGGVDYLRRPGKEDGISATLGKVAPKVLYVFSTNASPFQGPYTDHLGKDHPGTPFDPFGIYARLEHRGDFTAAAKALAAQGYSRLSAVSLPTSDPWEGMPTLPVSPYRGYHGLHYGKVVRRG